MLALRSSGRFGPPSIPAIVFILLATLVPVGLQKPMLNSDGDLARHLRHGQYMLEHGELIRADPFSFTRPGAPFIGFEYGSQLLYALAERVGGLPAVAILAGLLIALTYALLTGFLLSHRVDPLLACLTVALAIALGSPHWTARPHLFSSLAVVILFGMLERGSRKGAILTTAVLFVVWANLHGGFVYGWILIALYLGGSLGELVSGSDRAAWRDRVKYYGTMLVTSAVATIVNPHGLELHQHLLGFFGKPFLRDNTAEFASPNFHEPAGKVFLAVLLVCLVSLTLHRGRPTLPRLFVICAGIAFALLAVRNIPLFGLTALPLLALHLDELWRRLPDKRGVRGRFETTARSTATLAWMIPAVLLMVALALGRGRLGATQLIRDEFDATVFPVAAVSQARDNELKGRLYHEFAWGGYLLYAWPQQRIYIDGGTDFFGEDLFREYSMIKGMAPGWRDRLRAHDISLMLLRRESPLSHQLARDGTWTIWYCDNVAVVFRRSEAAGREGGSNGSPAEGELNACARRASTALRHRDE
jgi:hypothetical protein